MNIDNYISSGAIESYVLGIADAQEAAEVLQLSLEYPEIKQAITDFEVTLEVAAFGNAIVPATSLKERLMVALQNEFAEPIVTAEPAKVVDLPFSEIGKVKRIKSLKYLAAACVILLIASAALNIIFYSRYTKANEQVVALLNDKNTLTAENKNMQVKYLDVTTNLQLLSDTNVIKVSMKGVAGKESNLATVYWNNKTKDVYLLANKLPEAPSDRQYQLWALVDGKPVDEGMLSADCNGVCKLKNIQNAQAFAITLEKKGGSPTPDLTQLQVIGNVKV